MEAMNPPALASAPAAEKLRTQMTNSLLLSLFMMVKLPLGFVAGLRVKTLDTRECQVTVPARWRNKNPFGSMYFAVQAMAAELSTGAPALAACRVAKPHVNSLIVGMTSEFTAQAISKVTFTCTEVPRISEAVEEAFRTGKSVRLEVPTVGTMSDGTVVSRFAFTWSFKRSRSKK